MKSQTVYNAPGGAFITLGEGLNLVPVDTMYVHGMDILPVTVSVSADRTRKGVARIMLKAEARASHTPEQGCGCTSQAAKRAPTLTVHTVVTVPSDVDLLNGDGRSNRSILALLAGACQAMVNGLLGPNTTFAITSDGELDPVSLDGAHIPPAIAALAYGKTDDVASLIEAGTSFVSATPPQ